MPSVRCSVIFTWTCLLLEQKQSFLYISLWFWIPWHGIKMLFNIHRMIPLPACFPICSSKTDLVEIDAFDKSRLGPEYLLSGLGRNGSQICWFIWPKNLLSSLCCGIFWSNHTSGSSREVWKRCDLTCRSCQETRLQGWFFEGGCKGRRFGPQKIHSMPLPKKGYATGMEPVFGS